jgi:hypothetical protein
MQKIIVPKEKLLPSSKPSDPNAPQLCCDICIKDFNSTEASTISPTASGRVTEDKKKILKSTTETSGSNLNSFSPVESLLALSNQVTMSKIESVTSSREVPVG